MTAQILPADTAPESSYGRHSTGILPSHVLARLLDAGREVTASEAFAPGQIQPASIDLRLGPVAYRVRASFLPGQNATVADKMAHVFMHEIDLSEGAVLEAGCVYIVPLLERAAFSARISGTANPKSSTGRIDVFTRLITDQAAAFDRVAAGYSGPLYAEICPQTFPVLVRKGSRLNQLRLRHGSPQFSDSALRRLHEQAPLVAIDDGAGNSGIGAPNIEDGLALSIDLKGDADEGKRIGFRAKKHTGLIDVDRVGLLDPHDFWEPIQANARGDMVLDPDEFYILVSRERVAIPPDHAAEMVPFNPLVGEFRVHYAGFFDPGFGYAPGQPPAARGVLEVRSREVPFILEHGQIIGRLVFERLTDPPPEGYGAGLGSNYQGQGLKLSKHFR
ncbi:MAG: 2'-deoxycytidine 5'-triphosphate deaminase [Alphaproteobacteria bacterium]|nr:2'-deoxycytidine 5'-triphosphate deaminase [Alphaproteobacteria bacterium]